MTRKQKAAIIAPPVLVSTMFPVYQLCGHYFGAEWGWYAGFLVYWPLWCFALPLWCLGWTRLRALFRRAPLSPLMVLLVTGPVVAAGIGRFLSGTDSPHPLLFAITAVVNGTLEEVLWRGLYSDLFPDDMRLGLFWPSLWFGVWHLAPGWVALGSDAWKLAIAAIGLGLAYGWVAFRTGSIRWTVASHVISGLLRV